MTDVLLIAGSPSLGSRSASVLEALRQRLEERGRSTQMLRVRDLPAEALLHAQFDHPELELAVSSFRSARVVAIATPIYKASLAGVLKAFLDVLPQHILHDKPVLPVATGGSAAHLLAVEYAFKPVLASLGAHTFFPAIYVQDSQILETNPARFDADIERRLAVAVASIASYLDQAEYVTAALTT